MSPRSAIFIDGAYLEKSVNKIHGLTSIDFAELIRALTPPHTELLRAYYYHALPYVDDQADPQARQAYERRERFFHALNMKGLKVRQGQVTRFYDASGEEHYVQKMVDTLLTLDLATLALKRLIEVAVVVAGDSDFAPAVDLIQGEGVRVICWHSPTESQGNALLVESDECYPLGVELITRCRTRDEAPLRRASLEDPSAVPAPRPVREPAPERPATPRLARPARLTTPPEEAEPGSWGGG